MKQKTCKECKEKFTPHPSMFCPPTCEKMKCRISYADKHLNKKAKEKRVTAYREKKAFNDQDVKKLTGIAKKLVQHYVRLRDISEPCISCRKPTAKQWDGGHFKNAEHYASVRFHLWNIHKQCSHCNKELGSNAIEYEKHLTLKIGKEKVEWLKNQRGVCKYNAEYLNKYIRVFRKKLRIMKKRIDK